MKARRIALYSLVVSVVVASLLAIGAILGGSSIISAKILVTSIIVFAASASALGALTAWEVRDAFLVSRLGLASTIASAALAIVGVWAEIGSGTYWKTWGTLVTVALAAVYSAGIWLTRLAPRHQWLRPIALVVTAFLAAGIAGLIWDAWNGEVVVRAIAVLAILALGSGATLGACHRLNRLAPRAADVAEVCYCPRCARRLWVPAGEVRCHHCNAFFFIELRGTSEGPPPATADPR